MDTPADAGGEQDARSPFAWPLAELDAALAEQLTQHPAHAVVFAENSLYERGRLDGRALARTVASPEVVAAVALGHGAAYFTGIQDEVWERVAAYLRYAWVADRHLPMIPPGQA